MSKSLTEETPSNSPPVSSSPSAPSSFRMGPFRIEGEYLHPDPYVAKVAQFHAAFGVHNPKRVEFPPRDKADKNAEARHKDLREVISCMVETAHIAREKSKKHGGKDILLSRAQLLTEELAELLEAMARRDAAHTVAEAADMMYVLAGSMLQLGLGRHLLPMFKEIHAANMSKLDPKTGEPFFDDSGKITKGPFYRKPNLRRVMNEVAELQGLALPAAGSAGK